MLAGHWLRLLPGRSGKDHLAIWTLGVPFPDNFSSTRKCEWLRHLCHKSPPQLVLPAGFKRNRYSEFSDARRDRSRW